jgi:hypothetical protein
MMETMVIEIISNLHDKLILKGLAYLDPGSGSFILQILIAALFGGLFLLKTFWKKIVNFFRGKSGEEPVEPPAPDDQDKPE